MLKSQLRSLGAVRDLHVQRIFLEQQATKFPQVALLREHLMRRERELIKPASRRMSNSKVKKLQRWIDRLEEEFAQVASDVVKQEEFAAAAWRCAEDAFAETVRCWRLIRLSDLRTIHHTRVAFKKFRYLVESFPTEMSGLSKRQLRQWAYYQRKMGNIQDLVVIQKCIADFIDENGTREAPLRPFCAYVRRRGGRALRAFRDSAEKLFQFWPLPGPDAASPSRSIHYAA
jgi:CHAD domain-containing protein